MATTSTKKTKEDKLTANELISKYMDYVLENEKIPASIFKFCKEVKIKEEDFYTISGSFEALQKEIWNVFFINTLQVMYKNDQYENFTDRDKVLTLFFTFFEILTLNRSYVLFSLKEHKNTLQNLSQLAGVRKHLKSFAKDIINEKEEAQKSKLLKKSSDIFSEGIWIQFLFLLKFWMDDDSASFEKTDIAIEKSVNTVFDVFDIKPIQSVIDFGKFLWKEKIS